MKGKTLAVLAMAAVALTTTAAETDRTETKNREFLAGYVNTDIKYGTAEFNGFNVEYRHFINDYFGFSGQLGYGYDSQGAGDLDMGNFDAAIMAKFPIQSFYFYGKSGMSYTSISASGTACNIVGCFEVSVDDSDFAPFFGFGVNAPIGEKMSFDVSYLIKKPKYDFGYGVKGESNMRIIMAQVGWRF